MNFDQIEEFSPPPNPTKLSDSRAKSYIDLYGYECWELDALEPKILTNLIKSEVEALTDMDELFTRQRLENEQKSQLRRVSYNWSSVVSFLNRLE